MSSNRMSLMAMEQSLADTSSGGPGKGKKEPKKRPSDFDQDLKKLLRPTRQHNLLFMDSHVRKTKSGGASKVQSLRFNSNAFSNSLQASPQAHSFQEEDFQETYFALEDDFQVESFEGPSEDVAVQESIPEPGMLLTPTPEVQTPAEEETRESSRPAQEEPHTSLKTKEDTSEQTKHVVVEDDEDASFKEDLAAIISGKKDFSPQLAPKPAPVPQEVPSAKSYEDGHAIFDKLAMSMEHATTFDIGDVDVEAEFDAIEMAIDRAEELKQSPPEEEPDVPDLNEMDLIEDFAIMQEAGTGEQAVEILPPLIEDEPKSSLPAVQQRYAEAAQVPQKTDYDVPGQMDPVAQPNHMGCWATVLSMMYSWRDSFSYDIRKAVQMAGEKWAKIFDSKQGLPLNDTGAFLADAKLLAEPGECYSVSGWEKLLRDYGPIWVGSDEKLGPGRRFHMRIITGIHGDGTPGGTKLNVVDPAGGREYTESVHKFSDKYEEVMNELIQEAKKTGKAFENPIQVIHFAAGTVPKEKTSSMALSESPTYAIAQSSVSDGLKIVNKLRTESISSDWKLDKATVADRLAELINDPTKLYQGSLNLCGPAAFFRLWIEQDPKAFAQYAYDLYKNKKAYIGSLEVAPDSDLVKQDYAAVAKRMSYKCPQADWMVMGALRDAENALADYEGTPEEDASAMTTPAEVASWLKATGLYSSVSDEGNWYLTKGLSHAKGLSPDKSCFVAMLVNAHVLGSGGKKKSDDLILSAFPNHFIILNSAVTDSPDDKVKFSYWSWGSNDSVEVKKNIFEANYYGAVIARK